MPLLSAPAPTGPVPLTIDQIVDALVYETFYWSAGQFTFSVPGAAATWPGYAAGSVAFVGYSAFTAAQGDRFRAAVGVWDSLIAPDFTEVNDATGPGNLRIAFSTHPDVQGIWGFAYGPSYLGGTPVPTRSGDTWVNAAQIGSDFAYGTFDWAALLHEVGHASGLQHPFEGATALPAAFQTTRYSIMAYDQPSELVVNFSGSGGGLSSSYAFLQEATPMVLDVAALQWRYGSEPTTRATDTVYTYTQSSTLMTTIFDGGGIDTINLSNFTRTSVVDLRPGSYSSLGFWSVADQKAFWKAQFPGFSSFIDASLDTPGGANSGFTTYTWSNNLGIAFGTIIENATGGSDEDWLLGNDVANTLIGNGGADKLQGGAGNDLLQGGAAGDTLQGGLGLDRLEGGDAGDFADYRDKTTPVVVTLAGAAASNVTVGGVVEDVLVSIEHLYGGTHSDRLFGDAASNALFGQNGNDVLRGGAGVDYLYGDAGIDQADYADKTAAVVITMVSVGASVVTVGGVAEDYLRGVEIVYGGSAADRLTGDGADNLFRGNGGADVIDGGAGVDAADFRDKTLPVVVSLNGANVVTATVGGVAEDTLRNIEQIYGGSGNDTLIGDGLNNLLVGGAGVDAFRGLGGADAYTGGAGRDVFYFNALAESTVALAGRDTINDFSRTDGDDIYLSTIDANTALAGDQAFVLGALAVGQAGRLAVVADGAGRWLVQGDVTGDGVADFAILVIGAQAPQAGDFYL